MSEFGVGKIFYVFKLVPYVHQSCLYLTKNTAQYIEIFYYIIWIYVIFLCDWETEF